MKLAVTYDNGQVFQHFGKTQQFKIYDIQEGKVGPSLVTGTGAKLFTVAGPVLAYGTAASVVYGIVLWVLEQF